MNLSSLFCNLADSIASYFISPLLPSLLSLLVLLLLSAWLFGSWLSVRLLNGSSVKIVSKKESQHLKARWALHQLRLIGPKLVVLLAVFYGGYLYHDSREFHNTYVLTNAVVDAQHGDYVTYHFEDDPTREKYTLDFTCSNYKPHFKPRQIIAKMTYARKGDCESLDGPQYVLKLRRLNGAPILEGE